MNLFIYTEFNQFGYKGDRSKSNENFCIKIILMTNNEYVILQFEILIQNHYSKLIRDHLFAVQTGNVYNLHFQY